jgi:GT2 family glycosyltransferase
MTPEAPSASAPPAARERIDVVIPVYNAPDLTRRCIESVYEHVADRIGEVHVHDDASDRPTADMLDALRWPGLRVHHAARNAGFGTSVNQAIARTRSPLVLVLNSDTEALDDFLSPLCAAMASDSRLAAVIPAGNTFAGYDLSRYERRSGCVITHSLSGYAFLVRRRSFDEVGGFDTAFGRGYYEDTDLSRRWIARGWWIGIHPGAQLHHVDHGSFREVDDFRGLLAENRARYIERHEGAARHVLLATADEDLDPEQRRAALQVLESGGKILWLRPSRRDGLLSLQMRGGRLGLAHAWRITRHQRRPKKRLTEIWIGPGVPALSAWMLRRIASREAIRLLDPFRGQEHR